VTQDWASAFIEHLQRLHELDRGAMAALRHSLAFAPGDDPKAYPYVERYVGANAHSLDARRLARYAVAGLFAMHPRSQACSLASALGQLMADKQRPSLELRFIALLDADADGLMQHLRQAIHLLAAADLGFDYARLLRDLSIALDRGPHPEPRDQLRRQWARDFYRAVEINVSVGAKNATVVQSE
jgi:CRISPR system Cascade subunit CasB